MPEASLGEAYENWGSKFPVLNWDQFQLLG